MHKHLKVIEMTFYLKHVFYKLKNYLSFYNSNQKYISDKKYSDIRQTVQNLINLVPISC